MENNITQIPLGSGNIYAKVFSEDIKEKLADDFKLRQLLAEVIKDENMLGRVSGGASLEYKPDFYTAEDDLGFVKRTIITKEETTLKVGLCTWNANTISQMTNTAKVTKNLNSRVVRIGGISKDDGKEYLIVFHHLDSEIGDSYIIIVGKNTAGFTIQFQKDKESVVDDEIKANVLDDEGTQVIYMEDIPGTTLHLKSEEGVETGTTKITVTEDKATGNSYVYDINNTIAIPAEGEDCSSMTSWDGTSEIEVETGKQLLVVEVDSTNKAVKAGFVTVKAKA